MVHSAGTIDIAGKRLKANFDLKHSHSDANEVSRIGLDGLGAQVGIKGKHSRLKYWGGVSYYGNEFVDRWNYSPIDSAGGEAGAKLKLGFLTTRVELSRFFNNVKDDAEESQTLETTGEVSLNLAVPKWPGLSLAYEREHKDKAKKAGSPTTRQRWTDSISGTIRHEGSAWETYATGSYDLSQQRLDSDYKNQTLFTELGLDYSSLEGTLHVSLRGSFVQNQDFVGDVDNQLIDASLHIVQDLGKILNLSHREQTLSFSLTQSRYMDAIDADEDFNETSALLLLKILQ